MLYTICHFLGVRRVEVSIGEPPQLVGLASGRVLPRRVIKCARVVGAQVDDDSIRFPCSKIVFLLCAKGSIALPHRYTAHLRIVGRHHMAHILSQPVTMPQPLCEMQRYSAPSASAVRRP